MASNIIYTTKTIYKTTGKASPENPQELWCTVEDRKLLHIEPEFDIWMTTHLQGGGSPDRTYHKKIGPTSRQIASDRGISMAKAKIVKKLKEDYVEHVGDDTFKPRPILVHKWEGGKGKITYPCVVQPKLDGTRCLFIPGVGLLSRGGEKLECPQILEDLIDQGMNGLAYDGELFCPDAPLQDTVSIVRSGDRHLQNDAGLGFYIFDSMVQEDKHQEEYQDRLQSLLSNMLDPAKTIHIIDTKIAKSEAEVDIFYKQCIDAGMEGTIIRDLKDGGYKWGKRVWSVLKRKEIFDEEFVIKGLTMDVEDATFGKLASYICYVKGSSGDTFKVTPARSKKERAEMWYDYGGPSPDKGRHNGGVPYCLQLLTVEFRGRSTAGVPLHAVGKSLRPKGM